MRNDKLWRTIRTITRLEGDQKQIKMNENQEKLVQRVIFGMKLVYLPDLLFCLAGKVSL